MKKLIAGVAAATALTFGGVAAAGFSPAHAADPYVVQPQTKVKTAIAGHTFSIKFNSGIVGLPASGKVKWTYVSTPGKFNKNGSRVVKVHQLHNGGLKLNLHGHAFPVPGTYVLKFHVVGSSKTFVIKVKVK